MIKCVTRTGRRKRPCRRWRFCARDSRRSAETLEFEEPQDALDNPNKHRGWWRSRRSKFMKDVWITTRCLGILKEVGENVFDQGQGCIRALVGDTAAATSALSCGTNDRDNNQLSPGRDARGGQRSLPGDPRRFRVCHGGELPVAMIKENW